MERQRSRLSRRGFVVGAGTASLGLLAGCGRLPWQASAPAPRPYRIAFLAGSAPRAHQDGLLWGLQDLGYVNGQNAIIERYYAQGRDDSVAVLAAELAGRDLDVIVVPAEPPARALLAAGWTKPIVMAVGGDPVGAGLAASLARPGGTVTGSSFIASSLEGKRLELLHEAVPGSSRIAVLRAAGIGSARVLQIARAAAQLLGVQVESIEVDDPAAIEPAIAGVRESGADALLVLSGPFTDTHHVRILEAVNRVGLPAMHPAREYVEQGGLMAYAPSYEDAYRRAAVYVDKILKGASPADLPIEQAMRIDFIINMKTARELGITFPNEIMLQVTEVIQ